jgi:hypothetical protein
LGKKIIETLVDKRGTPVDHNGLPRSPADTAIIGLPVRAATADALVEAFMSLSEDSALEEYFLKNLVRHICGYEAGGILSWRGVF